MIPNVILPTLVLVVAIIYVRSVSGPWAGGHFEAARATS
jgi:hypothetical protein